MASIEDNQQALRQIADNVEGTARFPMASARENMGSLAAQAAAMVQTAESLLEQVEALEPRFDEYKDVQSTSAEQLNDAAREIGALGAASANPEYQARIDELRGIAVAINPAERHETYQQHVDAVAGALGTALLHLGNLVSYAQTEGQIIGSGQDITTQIANNIRRMADEV